MTQTNTNGLLLFLECPKHSSCSLNLVCTDFRCSEQGLICCECLEDEHVHHEYARLKEFVAKTKQMARYSDQDQHPILPRITQLKLDVENKFYEAKEAILKFLEEAQHNAITVIQALEKTQREKLQMDKEANLKLQGFSYKITEDYQNLFKNVKQAVKDLKSHHVDKNQDERKIKIQQNIHLNRIALLQELKSVVKHKLKKVNKLIGNVDPIVVERLSIHKQQEPSDYEQSNLQCQPLKWSNQLKHKTIIVKQGRVAISTEKGKITPFGVLGNRVINLAPPLVHQWEVKILNQKSVIDIGICIEDAAQQCKFTYGNWTQNGHGNYTISSEGRLYSSIDKTLHKKMLGFTFTNNDIIRVEYKVIQNSLKFTKITANKSDEVAEIEVQKLTEDRNYRPCVYFVGENSSVELLGPQQIS